MDTVAVGGVAATVDSVVAGLELPAAVAASGTVASGPCSGRTSTAPSESDTCSRSAGRRRPGHSVDSPFGVTAVVADSSAASLGSTWAWCAATLTPDSNSLAAPSTCHSFSVYLIWILKFFFIFRFVRTKKINFAVGDLTGIQSMASDFGLKLIFRENLSKFPKTDFEFVISDPALV